MMMAGSFLYKHDNLSVHNEWQLRLSRRTLRDSFQGQLLRFRLFLERELYDWKES